MNHKTITPLVILSLFLVGAACSKQPATSNTNTQTEAAKLRVDVNSLAIDPSDQLPTVSGCPQEGHIKSPASTDTAKITFDNQTAGDLKVYWIDFNGARKYYRDVKAHTTYTQATWIGHVWVVADSGDQCVKLESANSVEQTLVIN